MKDEYLDQLAAQSWELRLLIYRSRTGLLISFLKLLKYEIMMKGLRTEQKLLGIVTGAFQTILFLYRSPSVP